MPISAGVNRTVSPRMSNGRLRRPVAWGAALALVLTTFGALAGPALGSGGAPISRLGELKVEPEATLFADATNRRIVAMGTSFGTKIATFDTKTFAPGPSTTLDPYVFPPTSGGVFSPYAADPGRHRIFLIV